MAEFPAAAIDPAAVETDMSAWLRRQVPGREMIPVSDIVEFFGALFGPVRPLGGAAPRRQSHRDHWFRRMRSQGEAT